MSSSQSKDQVIYGKLIGLTGGIASGKSTVSRLLSDFGAYVIDADQVARDIVQVGQAAWQDIKERWGDDILQDDQQLDRQKLAQLVFQDPNNRKILEQITHPRIAQESTRRIQDAFKQANAKQQKSLIVYDAALLIESKRQDLFRPLVLVTCVRENQIQRIMQRDHLTQTQAEQRLNAQMSLQDKIPFADHILNNDSDIESLQKQVKQLWQQLLAD